MIRVAIVTVSDSCAKGQRADLSGPAISERLPRSGFEVLEKTVVPDDRESIVTELMRLSNQAGTDLVLTTGGTGLGPRDITPEATASVCERMVPGLAELMRLEGLKQTPNAVLSRAVCGVRHDTLIVNLPGSVKAVRECLEAILNLLPHAIEMMHGGGHERKDT
ncbi:MAG: MogA/MoaB family molybdenum cofactor biosynthesis protein [Sedimentisphaerales bacterium]|nr:MogA/MoaB family molybdenum cofactor biosynthesis protein [Sedimentisphaerales bacterium]